MSANLDGANAVLLLSAWVSTRLAEARIRSLLIKGPVLAMQGLRPDRRSSDVDVLVDPRQFGAALDLLAAHGWRPRAVTYAGRYFDDHSVSVIHDAWPCDIDVHHRYPGFAAESGVVFDELWERRTAVRLAGIQCVAGDRIVNVLVAGLHALRGAAKNDRHMFEYRYLLNEVRLSPRERQGLTKLAARTGCLETGAEILRRLGSPEVEVEPALTDPREVKRWRRRVAVGDAPAFVWISALETARGSHKLRVLRHALWPTGSEIAMYRAGAPSAGPRGFAVKLVRAARGSLDLLKLLVKSRRG